MSASRVKTLIIGVLMLALSACSAVRLGYNNGPTLAYWWLDGYLDIEARQSDRVQAAIDDWFAWHRATQLPVYAKALAEVKARAAKPVSPAQICAWVDDWRNRLDEAVDRALPAAARLLPEVGAAQWAQQSSRAAEKTAELRREIAPADPAERAAGALRRAVERAETLYGELDATQRRMLAQALAESPFDPARWLADRERRQADLQRTARALQAADLTPAQRLDGLRALALRSLRSRHEDDRAYQERLTAFHCRLAADLHNSTSPTQREHLRQRLASWEEDLRALAAQARAQQNQ